MTLKLIVTLALASGAAAADKICMADETNTRARRAAVSSCVPWPYPPPRRFHFKLNPYVSQTGYYVVEEPGAVQKSK